MDIKQLRRDVDNGVLISTDTWHKLLAYVENLPRITIGANGTPNVKIYSGGLHLESMSTHDGRGD